MNRADRVTSFVTFILSIYIIVSALNMNYWHDTTPGPGFMPLWAGIMIGFASIYLFLKTFIKPSGEKSPFEKKELKTMMVILGGVVVGILLTFVFGLMIALCLMMIVMMKFLGTKSWKTICLVSIISTAVLYLTFVAFLGVPMPDSLIGI
jgi:putative tricarboxylic transport membrane protein